MKDGISLATPRYPKVRFKVSHLCYASIEQPQYETTVKLLGSFRLTAGTRHLYRDCIFTEQVLETVSQSLRHSCTSELTRQGIALLNSYSLTHKDSIFNRFITEVWLCNIWSLVGYNWTMFTLL